MMFTLKTSYAALNIDGYSNNIDRGSNKCRRLAEPLADEICETISSNKRALYPKEIKYIIEKIKSEDALELILHYVDYQKRLGDVLDALVNYPKGLRKLDLKWHHSEYTDDNIAKLCEFLKKSDLLSFKLELEGATKEQINAIMKDGLHISQRNIFFRANENNTTIISLKRDNRPLRKLYF